MRFFIVYSVLVAFSFLSLTPAGVSLAELRADDDLELDELDLGLEEDEEEESDGKKSKSSDSSEDEEDEEDTKDSVKEDEDESSEDEEDEEDAAPSKKTAKSEDSEEEAYVPTGKKIAAFYFFEDSHTLKSASHVAAETAKQLENSSDFDYVGTEASLFSVSSSAQSVLKKAKKEFDEGKALYDDFNAEDAIEKFQSSLKYLEDNMDKVSDMKFLSEVVFYIGASYKLIDEDRQAETYFLTYISMNPDAQPDESKFSSEVISAFNSVKKNQGRSSKGSIKVSSNPDGALVLIDGKIAGMTPATIRGISEGKHYYRIHKNGYRDAGGTIAVKGGKTATISETVTKYSQASSMFSAEKEMSSDFGQSSMFSKSLEIARELDLDNVLLISAKLGSDERLNYVGYMIDREKREYKKSQAVFDVPEKGHAADSSSLKEFNKALINDPYEYKSISDVFAAEVNLLASDNSGAENSADDEKKEGTPVYKAWWLWTIVGVVAAAGVVLAVDAATGNGIDFFGATGGKDNSKGATLKVSFE